MKMLAVEGKSLWINSWKQNVDKLLHRAVFRDKCTTAVRLLAHSGNIFALQDFVLGKIWKNLWDQSRKVRQSCMFGDFFGSSIGHLLNKLVIKRLLILESSHHILVFPGLETFCLSDNWYQWGDLTKTDTEKNNDIDIDIKIAQLKMRHFGDLFSLV